MLATIPWRNTPMRLVPVALLLCLLGASVSAQIITQPSSGSGSAISGSAISACTTSPPTTGSANSFCYDPSNTLWKCSNGSSACTTSAQWRSYSSYINTGNWFPIQPPDFTTYSWNNMNTASYAIVNGLPVMSVPYQSGTTQWNSLVKAVPAGGAYTLSLVFTPSAVNYGTWQFGLSLQDASNKCENMMVSMNGSYPGVFIYDESSCGVYAGSETQLFSMTTFPAITVYGVQVVEDGTHRTYNVSADGGTSWLQVYQVATGAYLTPVNFGIIGVNITSTIPVATATVYLLGGTHP